MIAMARRRTARTIPEPVFDLGPQIRHQRGELVVEDAPDPDAPNRTVRRGRGYDPLRRMEDLDPALFLAAERFRNCYALADGARQGTGTARLEPWQRSHYQAARADARAEYEGSMQAVGLRLGAVFVAAVLGPMIQTEDTGPITLRSIERSLGMRNGTAADCVREALERLRDYQTAAGRAGEWY
jgi:hypothetical protein